MSTTSKCFCMKCMKVTDCNTVRLPDWWQWWCCECGSLADDEYRDDDDYFTPSTEGE